MAIRNTNDAADCAERTSTPMFLLPFGGRTRDELYRHVKLARSVFSQARSSTDCALLYQTLATRSPARGPYRLALLAESVDELLVELDRALSADLPSCEVAAQRPRLVFVCSGQGSQWAGMARTLLRTEPAFLAVIEACDGFVRDWYGWSLLEVLDSDDFSGRLDATDVAQLSIASVQLALGALWRSWGIVPDALMGHSLGEVTACGLAGILSLRDTLRVVGERACILRDGALERGGMIAVTLPAGRTSSGVMQLSNGLDLAAYNSPNTLVLSGSTDAIRRIEPLLRAEGFNPQCVNVKYASHCAYVDPCLSPLRERLKGIEPRVGELPVRGTSREGWLHGPNCGPEFWAQNLRNPVQFRQAVEALAVERDAVFVELSPHPLLLDCIAQTLRFCTAEVLTLPSCRRGEDEQRSMRSSLAKLFRAGFAVEWADVLSPTAAAEG